MLIEQIIEFKLRGPGPSCRTCTPSPISCYFNEPQTPVFVRFELHKFTLRVSQFRHFHFLTISLSPFA